MLATCSGSADGRSPLRRDGRWKFHRPGRARGSLHQITVHREELCTEWKRHAGERARRASCNGQGVVIQIKAFSAFSNLLGLRWLRAVVTDPSIRQRAAGHAKAYLAISWRRRYTHRIPAKEKPATRSLRRSLLCLAGARHQLFQRQDQHLIGQVPINFQAALGGEIESQRRRAADASPSAARSMGQSFAFRKGMSKWWRKGASRFKSSKLPAVEQTTEEFNLVAELENRTFTAARASTS